MQKFLMRVPELIKVNRFIKDSEMKYGERR
jgi:hypothetical protein